MAWALHVRFKNFKFLNGIKIELEYPNFWPMILFCKNILILKTLITFQKKKHVKTIKIYLVIYIFILALLGTSVARALIFLNKLKYN